MLGAWTSDALVIMPRAEDPLVTPIHLARSVAVTVRTGGACRVAAPYVIWYWGPTNPETNLRMWDPGRDKHRGTVTRTEKVAIVGIGDQLRDATPPPTLRGRRRSQLAVGCRCCYGGSFGPCYWTLISEDNLRVCIATFGGFHRASHGPLDRGIRHLNCLTFIRES
jgi:hypothetical protein